MRAALRSEAATGPALARIHPEDLLLKARVPKPPHTGRYNVLAGIVASDTALFRSLDALAVYDASGRRRAAARL